jgi:hypothetical protein
LLALEDFFNPGLDRSPRQAAVTSAAAAALAAIKGAQEAQAVLQELRSGTALPEALHEALQRVRAAGDGARLRAFTREVQKALESAR